MGMNKIKCSCGKEYHVSPSTSYFRCISCNARINVKNGETIKFPSHWPALHQYPIDHWEDWDPHDACSWYLKWCEKIPSLGCSCRNNWNEYTGNNPPYFTGPRAFFEWGWQAHDYVSAHHSHRPRFSLAQAYGIFRKSGPYETTPPDDMPAIDVVVPFWKGDQQYVLGCVSDLLNQKHVAPVIHLIADGGAEFPEGLPSTVKWYRGPSKNVGPYALTNALVAGGHCQTPYLALQDVDDCPVPDRLWRQLATMQKYGYEMVSGGCRNIPSDNYQGNTHKTYPEIWPWRTYNCVPKGHLVNSCRTMTLDLFKRMNGFTNHMCSMDFDFDNRVLHVAGNECIPVFGAKEIDITRRLRDDSLSNGGDYGLGTPNRERVNKVVYKNLDLMIKSPTLAQAHALGSLNDCDLILTVEN